MQTRNAYYKYYSTVRECIREAFQRKDGKYSIIVVNQTCPNFAVATTRLTPHSAEVQVHGHLAAAIKAVLT